MKFRRQPTSASRRHRVVNNQSPKIAGYAYSSSGRAAQSSRSKRQSGANKPAANPPLKRFWLQRTGLLIFLLAVVISLINILRLTPSAEVRAFNPAASQTYLQPTAVYAAAADANLKSSIWNSTKLTVDAGGLQKQLLNQFPELTSVSVTVPLIAHRPLIYVQAAQPALVLNSASGAFIVGTSGKALAKLPDSTKATADLPQLVDQSGLSVAIRQQVLPAADVRFVQIVVAELAAKQFTVSGLTLPAASSELDAHLEGQAYFVKFNLQDSDPAGEAGAFLATINSLKRQNITPSQYVDVRVSGRAYYR